MEKFNKYVESIILTIPTSDSVGPVAKSEPAKEIGAIAKDGFSQTADDILNGTSASDDTIQPDDNVGEFGEIEGGEQEECDCNIEATDEGLSIDFNGFKIVLPDGVREKLKTFLNDEDGTETSESEESEESTESDESESSDTETEDDADKKDEEKMEKDDVFVPAEKKSDNE